MTTSRPLLRLVTIAAVTAATLSLSGCLYAQIPDEVPTIDVATTDEPDAPADEPAGDLPRTLGFAEGQELSPTVSVEWGDGLLVDDGWVTESPDDGNGGWSYATADGSCTARFWQGLTSDVAVVDGDDSASSDAILAALLRSTAAVITPLATTGEFSYQVGGSGGVENRQIVGADGERTWVMAARAFTAIGVGLYVIVDCSTGDAATIMSEVTDKNAVVVTP
ncbi:hypothetical protein SRABI76_03062 [Microbacterium oxydans]|uniref:hypothetical protein n=1 Tax=Microbacterium oxydans TaxID=82380 RepID=UPI001D211967|nr:hypothetical protein [Microbacterium oxydans]CAH0243547.1 hypothetical protein SRABI76_03062 [Microbacterium oxydans]